MGRTLPFLLAMVALAVLPVACGSTSDPSPADLDPDTDSAPREVVHVLADGTFRLDGRAVAGADLWDTWAGEHRPACLEIRVADEDDPAQMLSALEAATASLCGDVRLVLPDGRASYLPLAWDHGCRAVDFQHGPAAFRGHEKVWNYVVVDVEIPRAGPPRVVDVFHDDRGSGSEEGRWRPQPGWDRRAPSAGDEVDPAAIQAFFRKLPIGRVEPLVRVPFDPDALPSPEAVVHLVNRLVAILGPRVVLGGTPHDEPLLEDEIPPEIDDVPFEAPAR